MLLFATISILTIYAALCAPGLEEAFEKIYTCAVNDDVKAFKKMFKPMSQEDQDKIAEMFLPTAREYAGLVALKFFVDYWYTNGPKCPLKVIFARKAFSLLFPIFQHNYNERLIQDQHQHNSNKQRAEPQVATIQDVVASTETSLFRLWLDAKMDVNITNLAQQTALHLAVDMDKYKYVDLLINAGANIHACDVNGKSPLDYAIKKNSITTLTKLLKKVTSPLDCVSHDHSVAMCSGGEPSNIARSSNPAEQNSGTRDGCKSYGEPYSPTHPHMDAWRQLQLSNIVEQNRGARAGTDSYENSYSPTQPHMDTRGALRLSNAAEQNRGSRVGASSGVYSYSPTQPRMDTRAMRLMRRDSLLHRVGRGLYSPTQPRMNDRPQLLDDSSSSEESSDFDEASSSDESIARSRVDSPETRVSSLVHHVPLQILPHMPRERSVHLMQPEVIDYNHRSRPSLARQPAYTQSSWREAIRSAKERLVDARIDAQTQAARSAARSSNDLYPLPTEPRVDAWRPLFDTLPTGMASASASDESTGSDESSSSDESIARTRTNLPPSRLRELTRPRPKNTRVMKET